MPATSFGKRHRYKSAQATGRPECASKPVLSHTEGGLSGRPEL